MIRFESDYTQGAHPLVLERFVQTNLEQTPGYGVDEHCENAKRYIQKACAQQCDVHFLAGGTQANTIVISTALRPYQGVIAADTGHIAVHETGAIEATGHKVLPLPNQDGKISAGQIEQLCNSHWDDATHEHMVQPGMVYLSYPTEMGTVYSKTELEDIKWVCRKWGLYLFVDGARLGYGLTSPDCDITLQDLATLCDVFYIGGTKVGALFGEAVVVVNKALQKDFRYNIKQRGGMLAKGRLLGLQFEALFENGLYFEISKHAVHMALKLKQALAAEGVLFHYPSSTNQQFPLLAPEVYHSLSEKYAFSFWEQTAEGYFVTRICTSWATQEEQVDILIKDIVKKLRI